MIKNIDPELAYHLIILGWFVLAAYWFIRYATDLEE